MFNKIKMLEVVLLSLKILILFQNQVHTAEIESPRGIQTQVSDNLSISNVFFLNGREHELPTITVIHDGEDLLLENGTSLKIPAFSNSTSTTDDVFVEIVVHASYPFYAFQDYRNAVTNPTLAQRRYAGDNLNETESDLFEQRWDVYLPYLKLKKSSFEFRSNVEPFFGSSVQWHYDENDDTVNFHSSPDIPYYRADFFDGLRNGEENADKCDALLFHQHRKASKTEVSQPWYGCSFADGTPEKLNLIRTRVNIVFINSGSVAHENCNEPCEKNKKCKESQLDTYPTREWTSRGYCTTTTKLSDDDESNSRKSVYFSAIYVSLPHGAKRTPDIYYKLKDVDLDKMISLDTIEEYHLVGSLLTIRCNISEAFAATPVLFALKYKGTNDLKFLPVELTVILNIDTWSRSTNYAIELESTDIERIFCFAPLLHTFGWINASFPIQVIEPKTPLFLHNPNLNSEEIPKTSVKTFSVEKTFASGSRNKVLTCYAIGNPPPKITWTWNRVRVSESKGGRMSHEVTWSQLLFSQVNKTREGEYICTATNSEGVANATINVIVTDDSVSETSSLVLAVSIPVGALVLIAAIATIVILIRKIQMSENLLTKHEYHDFLYGNNIKNNTHPNSNIFSKAFDSKFIIDRRNLVLDQGTVLGSGQYGVVMKGWLHNLENVETAVAVKTTKENVDVMYAKALISEVKIMTYVGNHRNVVGFLGACIENLMQGKLLAVFEFCDNGDLLSCLRKKKTVLIKSRSIAQETTTTSHPNYENVQLSDDLPPVLLMKLVQWSRDIASGMEFIGSKNIIHGDLAARNVLVDVDNVAKISDFGLSRQLLQDYTVYKKTTATPLPWRWMAPESLTIMNFSVQSDTWAFGVTLWEIFSLGDSPYPGCNYDEEFLQKLSNGFCPSKPAFASDEWYQIMRSCWNLNPELRPERLSLLGRITEQEINVASPKIAEFCTLNYTNLE